MENRPLVNFIRNYIRDSSGVFSISSLVRISMTSFPTFALLFVQKYSCLYSKKKITRRLEDMNFIFRSGKKQYFTHSLCSFVKYCFLPLENKFISSLRRAISSIYFYFIFFLSKILAQQSYTNNSSGIKCMYVYYKRCMFYYVQSLFLHVSAM